MSDRDCEHFRKLTDNARAKVLRFIADGPDIISYSRGQARWTGKEPNAEQISRYVKHWQLDWLAFIKDALRESRRHGLNLSPPKLLRRNIQTSQRTWRVDLSVVPEAP